MTARIITTKTAIPMNPKIHAMGERDFGGTNGGT
jgi:hypothetical protein